MPYTRKKELENYCQKTSEALSGDKKKFQFFLGKGKNAIAPTGRPRPLDG